MVCKIHLVNEHLAEELEQLGRGTALFKKSAGDSLHADFNCLYQGYLVKDVDAPLYMPLKCTTLVIFICSFIRCICIIGCNHETFFEFY